MTIVVDVNTLPCVFSTSNEFHDEFFPVARWIEIGEGLLVFGGRKYKEELAKMPRYLRLVRELKDQGKAVSICDKAVGLIQTRVQEQVDHPDCDDPHIIGILGASRCFLLCSRDARSFRYIKDRSLYPCGCRKIRIYTGKRNAALLCRANVAALSNVV